jgi:hypothetical protein
MRLVVLKSSVNEKGRLVLHGLNSITQKSFGVIAQWLDLEEANTNCIEPEKCDLLSFEDKDQLEEDLEVWGIAAENVTVIGVEANNNITTDPQQ